MAAADTLVGLGAVLTPVALVVTSALTLRGQREIHREVKTANGKSLGVLAESTEGRRILADVAKVDRTTSEQGYVDRLQDPEGDHR